MGYAALILPPVLVIGTASVDVLHLPDGRHAETIGGAGLYTALAVQAAGTPTTLLAPRPEPLPPEFEGLPPGLWWQGPSIAPTEVTRLEIAHHGAGRATLVKAAWGAEDALTPADVPADLSGYAWVHLAALRSAQRQLDFLQVCRAHGAVNISVGTYGHVVRAEPDQVRALWAAAEAFFMNENEAALLFGSLAAAQPRPGGRLFVTRGAAGALAWEGQVQYHVPAPSVEEVDPTGAGDTFCGTTLAWLAQGASVVQAIQAGVTQASRMITQVGPGALWI